jgi:alkyl sulfatase BDS1-like metallo-beta-lactamase superfamily hydrolase
VNGPRAWDQHLRIDIVLEAGEQYRLQLRHGVLTYTTGRRAEAPDAVVTLPVGALAARRRREDQRAGRSRRPQRR